MPYPVDMFTVDRVRCPCCRAPQSAIDAQCHFCGYSLAASDAQFQFQAPPLGQVVDTSSHLGDGVSKVRAKINSLTKRFPDIGGHVAIVDLPPKANLSMFGHWLFNRAPKAEGTGDRAWALLLVANPSASQLSAQVGYSLDPFLSEPDLDAALNQAAQAIDGGSLAEGVIAFFSKAEEALKQSHSNAKGRIKESKNGR